MVSFSRRPMGCVALVCVVACGGSDGLVPSEPTVHNLSATPGCWTPAPASSAPSSATSGGSDAFAQMMDATQQVAQFHASFEIQHHQLIVAVMRRDPGADLWLFDSSDTAATRTNGLSGSGGRTAGGAGAAPGSFGSGTMTVPGRRPGLGTVVVSPAMISHIRIRGEMVRREGDTGEFAVELVESRCTSPAEGTEHCDTLTRVGTGFYNPSSSGISLGNGRLLWSDHFVSLGSKSSSVPLLHRGCSPQTGDSFETRLAFDPNAVPALHSELICWDAAGEWTDCAGVDVTPAAN